MKPSILIAFLLLTGVYAKAQYPTWLWASEANNAEGYATTTDSRGNVYVTGAYNSPTITFGNITLTNQDPSDTTTDIFVVKMDSLGNVIWAQSAGGDYYDVPVDVAIDTNGNVYITGYTTSATITFGSITLTNAVGDADSDFYSDVFVAKYDSTGAAIWAKNAGNAYGYNIGYSIKVDASNNILVTGQFQQNITFGSATLRCYAEDTNSFNFFLVKYGPTGNVLWTQSAGEQSDVTVGSYGVTTDNDNNVYVTGEFYSNDDDEDNFTFGDLQISFDNPDANYFLVKYNSSGNAVWQQNADGGYAYNIASDGNNHIFATGSFGPGNITLGSFTLNNADSESYDGFTVKYDTAGNVLWAQGIGGTGGDVNMFDVSADNKGNAYVSGSFQSPSISIGSLTLVNAADSFGTDAFIAKYDSTGTIIWAQSFNDSTTCYAVCNDPGNNLYVAGYYNSFTLGFGDTTLVNDEGGTNVFLAKLSALVDTTACTVTLSPDSFTCPDASASVYEINDVIAGANCSWSAAVTSGNNWLVASGGGTGNGSINIEVQENLSDSSRTGTIGVNGQTLTIIQPPIICNYSLSQDTFTCSGPSAQAYNACDITTGNNCDWTDSVIVGADWLGLYFPSGVGSSGISISVSQNTSDSSRTGIIAISGNLLLTVIQPGTPANCTYSLSNNVFVCPSAAIASYNPSTVNTQDGCPWVDSVTSGNAWLIDYSSGVGNGTISIDVEQNTTPSYRTGTIDVAGQTLTIIQPGTINCSFNLSSPVFSCPSYTAGTYNDISEVKTDSGCNWSAIVTSGNAWLSCTSYATGSDSVSITVLENGGDTSRSGTININGQTLTVAQPANTMGINPVSNTAGITVYPNPSAGQFYFKGIKGGSTLEVYDVLGQNIYSAIVTGDNYLLDISGKAKGVYFYRVIDKVSIVQQGKMVME